MSNKNWRGAWRARIAILPQAGLDHQLAQRLAGHIDSMTLDQVLASQSRAEVVISFTDNRNDLPAEGIAVSPIARPTTLARNQTPGS